MAAPQAAVGLSMAGQAFFGGLCTGTFGLGCWQTRRYFEKVDEIKRREVELAVGDPEPLEPYADANNTNIGKKVIIEGSFRHQDEVVIGPRGAPKSANFKKGRQAQGMATNPQGYFLVTPFERLDGKGTVLIKRGWVPYSYMQKNIPWHRPKGIVEVTAVADRMDKRKYFSPQEHPSINRLIWFDRRAIEGGTNTSNINPAYFAQVNQGEEKVYDLWDERRFPIKAGADALKEFTITPEVHLSYAVTWFGLSSAGVMMTRKLMLRGRG